MCHPVCVCVCAVFVFVFVLGLNMPQWLLALNLDFHVFICFARFFPFLLLFFCRQLRCLSLSFNLLMRRLSPSLYPFIMSDFSVPSLSPVRKFYLMRQMGRYSDLNKYSVIPGYRCSCTHTHTHRHSPTQAHRRSCEP